MSVPTDLVVIDLFGLSNRVTSDRFLFSPMTLAGFADLPRWHPTCFSRLHDTRNHTRRKPTRSRPTDSFRWGSIGVLIYVAVHVWLGDSHRVLTMAIAGALLGLAGDTTLVLVGALTFMEHAAHSPLWMVSLWAALGVTLTASMRSFCRLNLPLAMAAAAVAGPIAYHGGEALGVLALVDRWAVLFVSVEWAFAAAVFLSISHALDGSDGLNTPAEEL